jgi:hypothetical protein
MERVLVRALQLLERVLALATKQLHRIEAGQFSIHVQIDDDEPGPPSTSDGVPRQLVQYGIDLCEHLRMIDSSESREHHLTFPCIESMISLDV